MKKKFGIFSCAILLSSCTTHFSYMLKDTTFQIQFLNENEEPISGIASSCRSLGGQEDFSKQLALELNQSNASSNEQGIIALHHNRHHNGGSYNSFAGIEWGNSPGPEVECNFSKNGIVIYNQKINFFQLLPLMKVHVKAI